MNKIEMNMNPMSNFYSNGRRGKTKSIFPVFGSKLNELAKDFASIE